MSVDLRQQGQSILDILAEVRRKTAERERLLAVLEMQARLMLQGIDPHQVRSYGYNPLTDKRPKPRLVTHSPLPAVCNFVILNDGGTRVDLETPVPIPPKE